MTISIQRQASFTVELPISRARALFTPEGERGWADEDWDPQYPDPRFFPYGRAWHGVRHDRRRKADRLGHGRRDRDVRSIRADDGTR